MCLISVVDKLLHTFITSKNLHKITIVWQRNNLQTSYKLIPSILFSTPCVPPGITMGFIVMLIFGKSLNSFFKWLGYAEHLQLYGLNAPDAQTDSVSGTHKHRQGEWQKQYIKKKIIIKISPIGHHLVNINLQDWNCYIMTNVFQKSLVFFQVTFQLVFMSQF